MINLATHQVLQATWETIYIVFTSGLIGITLGLFLGLILYITHKKQSKTSTITYTILSFLVNAGRSLPFIILLISITPLTHLIIGTTIGANAAIIPLTISAIPFFARIAESSLLDIPNGILETADTLGVNTWELITKFLIPESLTSLIKGATLTVISLIGCSAMAGAVGGGGLGQLAINYGYERFNITIIFQTVIILIAIVQVVQFIGDRIAKSRRLKIPAVCIILLAALCVVSQISFFNTNTTNTIKVGVASTIDANLLKVAKQYAKQHYGLNIKIIQFDDYVQPNEALNNHSIDANIFQHVPYLNAQIKARNYKITPIAKTFVYPFGFYSKTIKHLSDLKKNAIIAIPNDPSNEGRALLLLQKSKIILLKPGVGLLPTPNDIISNRLHLKFVELNAAQIPRSLNNVSLGGLTNDYTRPAGLTPSNAILLEGSDSPYANVIAVRTNEKNKNVFKELTQAIHSKEYTKAVLKQYPNGAAIPAYTIGGK